MHDPRILQSGKLGMDFRQNGGRQRLLLQIGEADQPGAEAVLEVVAVVGDIVGDRRCLRFEAGMEVKLQVLPLLEGADGEGQRAAGVRSDRSTVACRPAGRCA